MIAFIRKNYEWISLVAALVICLVLIIINYMNPLVCTDKQAVVEILELQYRDAIVLLANGEEHTVNQIMLKPGDSICVQYERQNEV